jgi:hypothetical protein
MRPLTEAAYFSAVETDPNVVLRFEPAPFTHGDYHHGDCRGDEAIFNSRCPGFISQKGSDLPVHARKVGNALKWQVNPHRQIVVNSCDRMLFDRGRERLKCRLEVGANTRNNREDCQRNSRCDHPILD